MKRKIVSLVLAVILICTVSAVMLAGCGGDKKPEVDNNENNNGGGTTPTVQNATTYVALDINPSLELILDQNNVVMSAKGLNTDAEVLLHGEDGIVGADVNVAIEKIGSLSTELNYINDENKTINISVTSKEGEKVTALKENIATKLQSIKEGVKVETEGNFTLQREYEAFKKEYKDNVEAAKITIDEYRLMAEAMAADASLRVEEAIEMGTDELIEVIADAREKSIDVALDVLPKAERAALKTLENTYEFALERIETGAYLTVDLKDAPIGTTLNWAKMINHINYITYKNIALSLEDINEAIDIAAEKLEKDVVNGEELDNLLNALVANEVIDEAKLADEKKKVDANADGVYSLDEVDDYLDLKLKNVTDTVKETAKEALEPTLEAIENRIDALEDEIPEEVKAKIANISDQLTEAITENIAFVNEQLPEGVRESLAKLNVSIKAAIKEAVDAVVNFDPAKATTESLEKAEEYADEKADMYQEKIEKKMSEKEGLLEKVDEYKVSLRENKKVLEAKTALEEAVKQATSTANTKLEAMKADQRNQAKA